MAKVKRRIRRRRIKLGLGTTGYYFGASDRYAEYFVDPAGDYIRICDERGTLFAYADTIRSVRALRRMCDDYLEARGVE